MTDRAADLIRAFARDAVAAARRPEGAAGLVAIGWATVDAERAVPQLAAALGVDVAAFVEAPSSTALGARCWIARAVGSSLDGPVLVVLEPSTEGRIAAALARWDEGPVAAWYASPVPGGVPLTVPSGPFGPERIVGGDPIVGPHRLLVSAGPGTIER